MAETFFDTNVLLYLISSDVAKADVAERVLSDGGHVSVQVLNEFTSVARRKAGLGWDEIGDVLGGLRRICAVHALTPESHDLARSLAEDHRLEFFDAAIVASAVLAGCSVLCSEDFQHGRRFGGGLRVRNPFRG